MMCDLDPGPGYEAPVWGLAIAALLIVLSRALCLVTSLTLGWASLLINNDSPLCAGVSVS